MSDSTERPANCEQRIGVSIAKVSSGLYVATAMWEGNPVGMLCSFVEQCSFEPPMISVAIARGRPIFPVLDSGGLFVLHILAKQNSELMKSFAKPGALAFTQHQLAENDNGLPLFSEAWAYLVCKASGKLEAGDHVLFTATVIDGSLQHPTYEPMIRTRSNGYSY